MRLYAQTILIIALTVIAVASVLLITFELTVMSSYSTLEQEYVSQDLFRAEKAITGEVSRISGIAQDWAAWDDTYGFIQDRNPAYLASNMIPDVVRSLNITAIGFYNLEGSLVSGLIFDKKTNNVSFLTGDRDRLFRSREILTPPEGGTAGIMVGYPDPVVIASHQIRTSKKEGPSRGVVVVANVLDDQMIKSLSLDVLRDVSITPIQGGNGSYTMQPSGLILSDQNLRKDSSVIRDLTGYPAYLLTIYEPGDLSRSSLYSRLFFFASLLLLITLFMGLASWLLNRIIISPLQVLNKDLLMVGESGSLSQRLPEDRHDEIGDLTASINTMLASLEQAQRERVTSEQRLARLIALVEEGICLIGPDGLIWFANPTMASIFDTTTHDLTGMAIRSLLVHTMSEAGVVTDTTGETPGDLGCREGEDPVSCLITGQHEYHNRTRTGRELWIRVATAPYPLDTGKMGYLCVVTDITPFRTAERELLLSNKKLALLGSMTRHDIVNQLTTIRGMLGLIKRRNTDRSLDQLIISAEDASERINKHIEFSKEYQKAGIEAPRWQDLRTVWNLAYAMSRRRGLTFTITGDNYEIYADQLLQKVFYNLIDNSMRHGKDIFYITISTKPEGSDLLIIYEDDGGGVPDAMKERIFERGVGTGTGWGLFFVHEVLELTGISISESGTYGIGAVFIIRVPKEVFRPVQKEGIRESPEPSPRSDTDPEGYPGDQEHNY